MNGDEQGPNHCGFDGKDEKKRWCRRHTADSRDGMHDNEEEEGDGDSL
jgi:hypothetical protein